MDKDIKDEFDIKLDEALSKIDLSDIDLLQNKELFDVVRNLIAGTDAGLYLNNVLEGDFKKSFSDEAEEELELSIDDFKQKQFDKIPVGREMFVIKEHQDTIDINLRAGPHAKEPLYKTGYVSKNAYFALTLINIENYKTDKIIKYSYKVEAKVESEY